MLLRQGGGRSGCSAVTQEDGQEVPTRGEDGVQCFHCDLLRTIFRALICLCCRKTPLLIMVSPVFLLSIVFCRSKTVFVYQVHARSVAPRVRGTTVVGRIEPTLRRWNCGVDARDAVHADPCPGVHSILLSMRILDTRSAVCSLSNLDVRGERS